MNKVFKLFGGLLCAALIGGILSGRVYARLTGTNPGTDVWCMGPSGAEVCVDVDGDLYPTTDNDTTLGTSTLRWATIHALDMTVGDDLTVTDDLTVDGDALLATGAGDEVAIGQDTTPDATLELVGAGENAFALIISSANGSTTLLSIESDDGALVQEGGAILNEGGAAVDLRVEGDNTDNLLIVDGSADAVGIGSDSTPDATLEVTPRAADSYSLRVSSNNGSTNILAVNSANSEVEMGAPVLLYTRTSAQLSTLTPRAAAQLVINTTLNAICISTGTGSGDWVLTRSTIATANYAACY